MLDGLASLRRAQKFPEAASRRIVDLAWRNASRGGDGTAVTNVEFHLASINNIPLPDGTADCVISNCVINLAPDKQAVFRESARILKSGGRLAISGIALKKPLPDEIADDISAFVGYVGGAMLIEDYRQGLLQAGFSEVEIIDSAVDLNVYGEVKTRVAIVRPLHSRAIYPSSNWVTARQLKSQTMDCICDWRDCSGVMT